ncbi:MAG: methionyl-tRNA formyltransferase [Verrucomicrobiota bacterium]
MRVVYLGTGEIGIPALAWLMDSSQVELAGVVTQPDRPAGRGKQLQAPPVKVWAQEHGLSIQQPASVNTPEALADLAAWQPDLIVVCAFGQILKQALLELPPHGCINIHASLLPRHRGASCIQAALLEGDDETGITIIQMDAGLDTGDCLTQAAVVIGETETASALHDRLAELAPTALKQAVMQIIEGTQQPQVQDETKATYAPKLVRQDGEIDWSQPVRDIERKMRALYSWPGSYTFYQNAKGERKRLKVLPPVTSDAASLSEILAGVLRQGESGEIRVAAADGEVVLGQVQPEGSKVMTAAEWARGVDLSQQLG